MSDMFAKEIYIGRRRELLQRMQGSRGIAVFIGNADSAAQYRDNCYKWRQDSNWLYFWGIDEPMFAATLDLESGEETIYADDIELDDLIWTGPMPTVAEQAASVGVSNTKRYSQLSWTVSEALIKGRPVHFLPVSRWFNAVRLSSLLGLEPQDVFSAGKKGCAKASRQLTEAVIAMRLVKRPEEIEILDRAGVLGQKMHTVARKGIRTGRIEQEIVAQMEAVTLAEGWGLSFPTILTQHGEIFHCHSHANAIEPGKLLVIDAGAETNEHYASDFTRTYPTSGRFSDRQRDIYTTVYECHELAFSLVKPGVRYFDVHQAVCAHMLENLSQLGLVKGSIEDMLAQGTAGLFMPHGLGHNMGLDVHDMEDLGEDLVGYDPDQQRSELLGLGSLRMARSLKPGNVVTDEPGIYFIPDLIKAWKAEGKPFVNYDRLEEYFDFGGIRIEDDVLVTEEGARRTGGQRLPASAEEVEQAMKEDRN